MTPIRLILRSAPKARVSKQGRPGAGMVRDAALPRGSSL
jgi:hypothetical protein